MTKQNSNYTDNEGYFWEGDEDLSGIEKYYTMGLIGLCGCADEELLNDILKVLRSYPDEGTHHIASLNIEGHHKYKELIIHIMNDKGILDHGTSVRYSWLTDKGKEIKYKLLKQ